MLCAVSSALSCFSRPQRSTSSSYFASSSSSSSSSQGTYASYKKPLEYPNGDTIMLELLCFANLVESSHAHSALQSLHDSIMWVHLSTGPEAHDHQVERKRAYALIEEREKLKAELEASSSSSSSRLAEIRAELKEVVKAWKKLGYKYTGAIYREIGMENSDYGGMEVSCRSSSPSFSFVFLIRFVFFFLFFFVFALSSDSHE